MPAPLEGIRILDFSHALAGPYCTLLLGDYGADVYKLESTTGGDMGRGWGPPFAGKQSSYFLGLNRGKRGIAIDLKRPEGIELCLRLIEQMDVLIENFRPGTMDRLNLGYDAVSKRNPRLVYCSISGYGQNGPRKDEATMDLIVECSSGYLSITGTEAGELARSGYAVADINAGLFGVIGILMALRAREQTGKGQFVDVSMFDSMISAMSSNLMTFLGSGRVPKPMGTGFPTVVPYRVFQAKDRSFSLAVGSEKLWSTFCAAIGRADLATHPAYATNRLRVENRATLEETLGAIFRERDMQEWIAILTKVGVPCSPVRDFSEVLEDSQSTIRGMFPTMECDKAGPHRVTGPPVKLSETPGKIGTPAPELGQHTHEVLRQLLNLNDAELHRLTQDGVIC